MTEPIFTPSSGNVFADINLSNPEARLVKAKLALAISSIMRKRGLNQKELAATLETNGAAISRIVRGRLSEVSLERLIQFLALLGHDVDVVVTEREAT